MLTAANRRSLVDNTIDSIRAAILAGTWPIGARVPTETELASLLAVSRNTVREAVSALAHSGLLEVRQGDGTYVRSQTDATGFFVFEPPVLDYIDGDAAVLEADTLARLAAERQLAAYQHEGFWQCMDTLREKRLLDGLWRNGGQPWKVWKD